MQLVYAPINVKPEGGGEGGQSNVGNLIQYIPSSPPCSQGGDEGMYCIKFPTFELHTIVYTRWGI